LHPGLGFAKHGLRSLLPAPHHQFFHRLAKANDYENVELRLTPQREFDLPKDLCGEGLPPRVASAGLAVVMRRRDRRKFVMPVDA
jgi:hypothetical protein